MQNYFVRSGQIQEYLARTYLDSGVKRDFLDALAYLHHSGQSSPRKPRELAKYIESPQVSIEQIAPYLPIPVYPILGTKRGELIVEPNVIPDGQDIFVIKHFNYIDNKVHTHNFFELFYIYKGQCQMLFEEEERTLNEGELCIISPRAPHDIIVDDSTSIVISIMIRSSTFDTVFFDLLNQDDLLSSFFKTMLYGSTIPNYLLFFTDKRSELNDLIVRLIVECYRDDSYANTCCIQYTKLLFTNVLRRYSNMVQYNYYRGNSNYNVDIPLILQYIQQNYRQLTLSSLAEFFHYSEPYLSKLIKRSTGQTFSEILTGIKMKRALDLLLETDMKVSAISEQVGYDSVDHFSRVFKRAYGMPPQQYRKREPVDRRAAES